MSFFNLTPLYQERIWGGQNLHTLFQRPIPNDKKIGESWELCDRPEAQSVFTETGKTLHELWNSSERKKVFGTSAPSTERFPILIKILDAHDKLSLQVHPPLKLAASLSGEPKTEMWVFLETTDSSEIYAGLKKGVTRSSFTDAVKNHTVADLFHRLKTQAGETMFLPSGRVHAIGAGNVILEIQQNSDTTYRVHDWDRLDEKTGKPRDLQIDQALECINYQDEEPYFSQPHGSCLVSCIYFYVGRIPFYEKETNHFEIGRGSFQYVFISHGRIKIGEKEFARGTSLFFPANSGTIEMETLEEYSEIITVSWPE